MTLLCPCCLNGFSHENILARCRDLVDEIIERNLLSRKIAVICDLSAGFDALRAPVRAVMTKSKEKVGGFPNFPDVFSLIMQYHMKKIERNLVFVESHEAEVEIEVVGHLGLAEGDSIAMCTHLYPEYQHKLKRVRLGQMKSNDRFEIGRVAVDKVLRHLKTLCIQDMGKSLKSYREHLKSQHLSSLNSHDSSSVYMGSQIKWNTLVTVKPLYILGRYRKLSRDVPQAPWDVRSNRKEKKEDNDHNHTTEGNSYSQEEEEEEEEELERNANLFPEGVQIVEKERLGRNSVEEIVSEAVCKVLGAKNCRMHPCGREDIDVRMLGNGRPFALEVIEASIEPTQELLNEAVRIVNNCEGMNYQRDIEVLFLELSVPSLFASMQPAAESKDKGYRCVVYSEKRLTRYMLRELERMASPELQLLQKTPLRVLHRRPLLNRKKIVHQLKTVYINEHYFMLSLNASAGTYIKEFVHGDFGRTVPSVSSILDTNANILQLDVMWLYDEFRGGGQMPSGGEDLLKCYEFGTGRSLLNVDNQVNSIDMVLNDLKLIPVRKK